MNKNEALQIALDALTDFDYDKRINAIEIIKKALETKQWVGLTDKEIEKIWLETLINNTEQIYLKDFAYSIEAKLKEKNYVKN